MTPDPLAELLQQMAQDLNYRLDRVGMPLALVPIAWETAWLREHRTELLEALGGEQDMTRDDTWLFPEVS